jgi:hypothetical protein
VVVNDKMRWLVAAVLGGAAPWAAASCFLVYAPSGELVYRSVVPPVDLSVPLSKGLAARYPNHQLIMVNDESNCPDLGTGRETQQTASRTLDITSMLQPRTADNAATAANDASMRAAGKSSATSRAAAAKPKP